MHYLVAVLDWGLGHASRCIPLINRLLAQDHQVSIASSGAALALLQAECASVPYFELPPYRIAYRYSSMPLNAAAQLFPALRTIRLEYQHIQKIIRQNNIDGIISDGRFGCYHPAVKSIWLAHQLQIQHTVPPIQKTVNFFYHQYIRRRFDEVWIPDFEGYESLSGQLSTPISGINHHYTGPLSRFNKRATSTDYEYDWIALLSGPEPQRSILEKALLEKLKPYKSLIIRGLPGSTSIQSVHQHVDMVNWLYGNELAKQIAKGRAIICRSGYSTIMDLHYWQKKALFIPTPGQTEQIYLAQFHSENNKAIWQKQGKIDLKRAGLSPIFPPLQHPL